MRHDNRTSYADLIKLDARWGQDTHAQDGMMAGGWRVVRIGGWVKALGAWWQNDKLIPFVGKRVWMTAEDFWLQECAAFVSRRRIPEMSLAGFICKLRDPVDKRGY